MLIFGVLLIPVFVTFGITVRRVVRSLMLRNAEQREGRIVFAKPGPADVIAALLPSDGPAQDHRTGRPASAPLASVGSTG